MRLAGVEAIVAEGLERIHRTNLMDMGVLPLQFVGGENRHTLKSDGIYGVKGEISPHCGELTLTRTNGAIDEVPVTCRLDSDAEVKTYQAGGVLQQFAGEFLVDR